MLSRKLRLSNILNTLKGKHVLIHVDLFQCFTKGWVVKDVNRIRSAMSTINSAFQAGAKSVVLMSHLEWPNGMRNNKDSLKQIVGSVEELAKRPVIFLNDCVGPEVEAACANPKDGSLFLLENLRFHKEEEGLTKVNGKKVKAGSENLWLS